MRSFIARSRAVRDFIGRDYRMQISIDPVLVLEGAQKKSLAIGLCCGSRTIKFMIFFCR